jgi:hypothetical protein
VDVPLAAIVHHGARRLSIEGTRNDRFVTCIDSRIDPDADCEGEDGQQRSTAIPGKQPESVAQVVYDGFGKHHSLDEAERG